MNSRKHPSSSITVERLIDPDGVSRITIPLIFEGDAFGVELRKASNTIQKEAQRMAEQWLVARLQDWFEVGPHIDGKPAQSVSWRMDEPVSMKVFTQAGEVSWSKAQRIASELKDAIILVQELSP